jgi:phospholipase C
LEGVTPENPNFNINNKGKKIFQHETQTLQMPLDPSHEVPDVQQQLSGKNGGFVQNFIVHYPASSDSDHQAVMGYYPNGFLPALHPLAKEYTVCDHWFSSVPGPTWANRFFALSGTSNGRVKMLESGADYKNIPELFYQTQPNIFDRLDERNISWRCYSGDIPISLVLTHQREPHMLLNYYQMDKFYEDAKGQSNQFPQFSFIEPKYLLEGQNDDHPPHNTMKAEKLIADVYNALRANNELWMSILLVLVYDEHGGFYDHVIPPHSVAPDNHREEGFTFEQLGLRVPAILISPWAKKSLEQTVFDHTSFLKYLTEKWQLADLGERTRLANNIAVALDLDGEPRMNCLEWLHVPEEMLVSPNPHWEKHVVNGNQNAIHVFADFLNRNDKSNLPQVLSPLRRLGCFKDKLGYMLESHGFLKFGEKLCEEAEEYRRLRNYQTVKIIGNKLAMFKPLADIEKKDTPEKQLLRLRSANAGRP